MPTVTRTPKISGTLPPEPGPTQLLEEVADLSSGLGLAFTSLLAAIPGLLPVVLLTVAALAIVAIPMVIAGTAVGAAYLLLRPIAHIAARAVSTFRPPAPEPERPVPSLAAPEFTRRLPREGPHAMV